MNHVYKVIFEPISHLTKVVDEYCHAHHGSSSVRRLTNKTTVTKATRVIHKEHPERSALLDALHSVHVPHLSRHELLALTEVVALLGMVCLPVTVNAETEKEELQRLRSQINELQKQVEILIKRGQNDSVVIGINPSDQNAHSNNSLSMMGGYVMGNDSVSIGSGSQVRGADNSLAMMKGYVDDKASNSVAIGVNSRVEGSGTNNSLAMMGGTINGTSPNAVSIGSGSNVQGGSNNLALVGGMAIGNNAIAIGKGAKAHISNNDESKEFSGIAIGEDAEVQAKGAIAIGKKAGGSVGASPLNGVAIGANAGFSGSGDRDAGAVALGADSKTDRYHSAVGGIFIGGKWNKENPSITGPNPVWKPTEGSVSIGSGEGSNEKTRRITHLAAGYEDTDAVNECCPVKSPPRTNRRSFIRAGWSGLPTCWRWRKL